ncbi:phage major capsid protein [Oenococcus oeni]|uniref:phage major capsid protein n=1 Tax=Oenococcus oeni TaxID=1247 RepID=UPI0010B5444C|nr:phage major capsid protein [Oenococcus oeni]SYW19484.1 putative HK97 family phage major capsid protein [Oenococcus oeni]
MTTINELQVAWENSGQVVSDAQNKQMKMAIQNAAEPGKFSDEELSAVKKDVEDKVKARDFAKDALDGARESAKVIKPKEVNGAPAFIKGSKEAREQESKQKTKDFVKYFVGMAKSGQSFLDDAPTSVVSTDGSGSDLGLTIPPDIQTAIHLLERQYSALEQYVNVENTSLPSGTRNYEKLETLTAMTDLDATAAPNSSENTAIPEGDYPELQKISYTIHRFANTFAMPNTLLQDSAENLLAYLERHISLKDVVTRNQKIVSVLEAAPTKASLTVFDDIQDLILNTLDPVVSSGAFLFTNQAGQASLAKVKDANGDYLLQPIVGQPTNFQIQGRRVVQIANRDLPDISTGVHPLYFGDLSQGVTLFDRQALTVAASNVAGNSFDNDQTKVRAIDRFDVEAADNGAIAVGSFTAIADQPAKIVVQSAS